MREGSKQPAARASTLAASGPHLRSPPAAAERPSCHGSQSTIVPEAESELYQLGSSVLGYDSRAGQRVPLTPELAERVGPIDDEWVASARGFGLHMTVSDLYTETGRVDFEALPWQEAAPGARYKAFQQGGRRLRLVEFTSEFAELDWCTKGHIGFVLEGELQVNFGGSSVRFCAGDGICMLDREASRHVAHVPAGVARLVLLRLAGMG